MGPPRSTKVFGENLGAVLGAEDRPQTGQGPGADVVATGAGDRIERSKLWQWWDSAEDFFCQRTWGIYGVGEYAFGGSLGKATNNFVYS